MNNQDPQLQSAIRSALKIIGAIALAHGATKTAGIINCEDMIGLANLVIGLLLSYQWHAPKPVGGTGVPPVVAGVPPTASPVSYQDVLDRWNADLAAALHPVSGGTPNTTGETPVPPNPQSAIGNRQS